MKSLNEQSNEITVIKDKYNIEKVDYMLPPIGVPFIDRLVITNHIENNMSKKLDKFLILNGFTPDGITRTFEYLNGDFKNTKIFIRYCNGEGQQFISFVFSGQSLRFFERMNCISDLFDLIQSVQHSITSVDFSLDTADRSFSNIYRSILRNEKKNKKRMSLGRKEQKGKVYKEHRKHGSPELSGYQIGCEKNQISGKIYDKKIEMSVQHNIEIDFRVRYEITINNKKIPTLTDLRNPSSLFYHLAPKMLLAKRYIPSNEKAWQHDESSNLQPWELPKRLTKNKDAIATKWINEAMRVSAHLVGEAKAKKILSKFS